MPILMSTNYKVELCAENANLVPKGEKATPVTQAPTSRLNKTYLNEFISSNTPL